jgi:Ca2+-binding RTX toxin-like protein
MRRAALLAVFGSGLLVAFAGVALAALIDCTGGRCEGTQRDDDIFGTGQTDHIFALGGFDFVSALGSADVINGQNGGDDIQGGNGPDTYNGGSGPDLLDDFFTTGRDVFNGGSDSDLIEGGVQADIIRGGDGDECFGVINAASLFGDEGNDDIFGGNGEDCMEGDAGTDEHFGGNDNDFIDAVSGDIDPVTGPLGTQDLVDCGSGFDTAIVNGEEDIVRANCEDVEDVTETTTRVAPPASGTSEEERQQIREDFIQEHGLQAEGG